MELLESLVFDDTGGAMFLSDRQCLPLTNCTAATQYEKLAPKQHSRRKVYVADRVCANATVCKPMRDYEEEPLKATADRRCKARTICCDSTNTTTCPLRDWDSKQVPEQGKTLEYEVSPGTNTTDRRCAHVSALCSRSQFQQPGTPNAKEDRDCTGCQRECLPRLRGGTPRSRYHPSHLGGFVATECKQKAEDGAVLYSELECLECPLQQQDVVFLLDFGTSMRTSVAQAKAFMDAVVARMSFRSKAQKVALGRVGITTFGDDNVQSQILKLTDNSSELLDTVRATIKALPGTAFDNLSQGKYTTELKVQIEKVLEGVVDNRRANTVNGKNVHNHSWDYQNQGFRQVETVVILLTDKSFLKVQSIGTTATDTELGMTCTELDGQGAKEKARLSAKMVAAANTAERFTRPFYEWVELNAKRAANGVAKTTTTATRKRQARAATTTVTTTTTTTVASGKLGKTSLHVIQLGGHADTVNIGGKPSNTPTKARSYSAKDLCAFGEKTFATPANNTCTAYLRRAFGVVFVCSIKGNSDVNTTWFSASLSACAKSPSLELRIDTGSGIETQASSGYTSGATLKFGSRGISVVVRETKNNFTFVGNFNGKVISGSVEKPADATQVCVGEPFKCDTVPGCTVVTKGGNKWLVRAWSEETWSHTKPWAETCAHYDPSDASDLANTIAFREARDRAAASSPDSEPQYCLCQDYLRLEKLRGRTSICRPETNFGSVVPFGSSEQDYVNLGSTFFGNVLCGKHHASTTPTTSPSTTATSTATTTVTTTASTTQTTTQTRTQTTTPWTTPTTTRSSTRTTTATSTGTTTATSSGTSTMTTTGTATQTTTQTASQTTTPWTTPTTTRTTSATTSATTTTTPTTTTTATTTQTTTVCPLITPIRRPRSSEPRTLPNCLKALLLKALPVALRDLLNVLLSCCRVLFTANLLLFLKLGYLGACLFRFYFVPYSRIMFCHL